MHVAFDRRIEGHTGGEFIIFFFLPIIPSNCILLPVFLFVGFFQLVKEKRVDLVFCNYQRQEGFFFIICCHGFEVLF